MKYQYRPYKADAFLELMNICYRMGWYTGVIPLFTLTMRGGFELSGRASECWDCDFVIELAKVEARPEQGVVDIVYFGSPEKPALDDYAKGDSLPGGKFKGSTLEEACSRAINAIKNFRGEEE